MLKQIAKNRKSQTLRINNHVHKNELTQKNKSRNKNFIKKQREYFFYFLFPSIPDEKYEQDTFVRRTKGA